MNKRFWKNFPLMLLVSVLMWLIIIKVCFGATYYVDSAVTDTNVASATPDFTTYNPVTFATDTGSASVYKTVADLNATSFAGDDFVLFRRGQTWSVTTLTPASSGTSGHPITFGVFGSGDAPILAYDAVDTNINTNTKSYLNITGLHLKYSGIWIQGGSGINFYYNIIESVSGTGWGVVAIRAAPTNTCNIYNNIVIGATQGDGLRITTGTVDNVKNNIIVGNVDTGNIGVKNTSGNNTNLDGNIISGNNLAIANNYTATGFVDGGHNQFNANPGFVSLPYSPADTHFAITFDDHDIVYWQQVAAILNPMGVYFTAFLDLREITEGEITDVATLAAAGNEIAVHSYGHNDLSSTNAFAITTTNANPTVDVDRPTKTITLATTTEGNTVTVDWSAGVKYISDLKTAVSGKGWTITNSTYISDMFNLDSLADTTGAQAVPYTPVVDVTSGNGYPYWANEVTRMKTWITDNIGVTPTTMSYPNTGTTANLRTWLKDVSGLAGARAATMPDSLTSVAVYNMGCHTVSGFTNTEAGIRALARHNFIWATVLGKYRCFLAHSASDMSAEGIGWYVDEILTNGGVFKKFSEIVANVKATYSTADNLTYTKSWTNLFDPRLQSTSPAINAGVNVGLTRDYAGTEIRGLRDIGAYERYQENKVIIMY